MPPPGKPTLVENASLQGSLFSCLGLLCSFTRAEPSLTPPAMPSAHTPRSPTHSLACFFPGLLPSAACLPVSSHCACMSPPSCSPFIPSPLLRDTHAASFLVSFQDTPFRCAVVPMFHLFLSKLPFEVLLFVALGTFGAQSKPPWLCSSPGMVSSGQPLSWHSDSEPIPGNTEG